MSRSAQNGPRLVWDYPTCEMLSQLIDLEPLMLFVEEIIDHSLRQNNLSNWIPTMNLQYLRLKYAHKRYFHGSIGEAICHFCTERDATSLAVKLGFDENRWLILKPSEAREQLVGFLAYLLTHAKGSKDSVVFQMFAYGCYVARVAMKRNLNELTNEVVQAVVRACCLHFPNEEQYAEFLTQANRYNLEHYRMHS